MSVCPFWYRCCLSGTEIGPPSVGEAFSDGNMQLLRGVCGNILGLKKADYVEFKEIELCRKSQSHSSSTPWLQTRSEICWTASYFPSTCF